MNYKKILSYLLLLISFISNIYPNLIVDDYHTRQWLYKMEPYINTNEEIKNNKIHYEIIIERNLLELQFLQDQKKNINNFFLLPTTFICGGLLAYTSYYIYALKGRIGYFKSGHEYPANTGYKIMSIPITITGVLSYLGYNSHKTQIYNIQTHIDRDLRILAALRNL